MSDTIFFIGAGTGLGLLIVRTLLYKFYAVFAGTRDPEGRNAERSQEIRAHAESSSGKAAIVNLDEEACRKAVDTIAARGGRKTTRC